MTSSKEVFYNVWLKLRAPSDEGKRLNITSRIDDVIYAVRSFNKHYEGEKEIKLVDVTSINEIIFLLKVTVDASTFNPDDVNARVFSLFSKRLYHDKQWSIYSRVESKLFTATEFELLTDKESAVYNDLPIIPTDFENEADATTYGIEEHILMDEQALEVFKALLSVKNIGDADTVTKRNRNVDRIKEILVESFR